MPPTASERDAPRLQGVSAVDQRRPPGSWARTLKRGVGDPGGTPLSAGTKFTPRGVKHVGGTTGVRLSSQRRGGACWFSGGRPVEPDTASSGNLHIVTFLPIKRWRDVPAFVLLSSRVQRQVRATPGLVAEAVTANFPKRFCYTYTIWESQDAMRAFLYEGPHLEAIKRFDDWRAPNASNAVWQSPVRTIDWADAMKRLETPTRPFPDRPSTR
ncbi:MAG: DUF3291 domain-containing protein [Dehalococcoidia bacterium]|nr:DUF3291 domain-containing protein [Dehalococcoidia bacterium]